MNTPDEGDASPPLKGPGITWAMMLGSTYPNPGQVDRSDHFERVTSLTAAFKRLRELARNKRCIEFSLHWARDFGGKK